MPNKADVKTPVGRDGKKARVRLGLPHPWQASYTKKEKNWEETERDRILGALAASKQQEAESLLEEEAPTPAESDVAEKKDVVT